MALEFYDTFTRVEATGLGVSDSGHSYTVGGTGSTSVDGDRGELSLSAVNAALYATVDSVTEADVDLTGRFTISDAPAGDSLGFMLFGRWASSSSYTGGHVSLAPSGTTTVTIREGASVAFTTAGDDWTDQTVVNIHLRMVGDSVRVKVWFGEDPEPANWTLSADHTSTNASGTVGFQAILGAASTASLPYILGVDSLVFSSAVIESAITDTFTRTVAAGSLGITDTDHVWDLTSGTASKHSVDGSKAVFSLTNDNETQILTIDTVITDFRMEFDVWPLDVVTSDAVAGMVRYADSSNQLFAYINFATAGTATLHLFKTVGGVNTTIASTSLGAYAANTPWSVIAEVTGEVVRAKAWASSTTEPASWTLSATDADLPPAGKPGIRIRRGSAGDAGPHSFYYDNITIRDVSPLIEATLVENLDSPGVRLTVHNGDVYHAVRVERIHVANSFEASAVRGLDEVPIPSAVASAVDYEIPLDETFIYRVYALNEDLAVVSSAESDPVEIEVPYHRVIIRSVGQPTLSRRVQVNAFPEFDQELRVLQEARVMGRSKPVILFDVMEGMTGQFSFMPLLDQESVGWDIRTLLGEGQPLLFQSVSRVTGIPDFYFVAKSVKVSRKTTIHPTELPRYIYTIAFTEVNRPPTDSESLGFFNWETLTDVGHTSWTSVDNTFTSWLSVLNFTGREPL